MRTVIPAGTLLPNADGTTPPKPQFRLKRGLVVRVTRLLESGRFCAVAADGLLHGYGDTVTLAINNFLPGLVFLGTSERPLLGNRVRCFARAHVEKIGAPNTIVVRAGTPIPPDGDNDTSVYRLSRGVKLEVREAGAPEFRGKWVAYVPTHMALGGMADTAAEAVADTLRTFGVIRALDRTAAKPEEEAWDFVKSHVERIRK